MISVCIPTYNGEKYIKEQLDSILIQLGSNDEVIISDDSSTDNTIKIIEDIKDSRIVLLKNNTFHSPIFNLENALKKSKGDIIFLSDQDDIWLEGKVENIVQLMKIFDCVVTDAIVIDSSKNIIHQSFFEINHSKKGFMHNLIKNSYLGCCMAINRKILDRALPFPKTIPMHDSWIGLVCEVFGKSYFLRKAYLYYRRHENNASSTAEKSKYSLKLKLLHRINLFVNIIKLIYRENIKKNTYAELK